MPETTVLTRTAAASSDNVMERLCEYMTKASIKDLKANVIETTKHHILDTVAAMVSGAQLKPGKMALAFGKKYAKGVQEAQVVYSGLKMTAIDAAIVNGMLAHSDETDDSNSESHTHPGCATVPAALAMAERENASGADFLNAVVLGYEINGRVGRALGSHEMRHRNQLSFSVGGCMGAAAAAGWLAGLRKPEQYRYLFSWGAMQASGIMTYARDTEHVEKAFVFGGMPARNGVTAAVMVQAGCTGVWDVFSGDGNFLVAFSDHPKPEILVEGLGSHYEVMKTNIKKFSVGFPMQMPLECLLLIMGENKFAANEVESVSVRTGSGAQTVNNRDMPSINLQHVFSMAMIDGGVSFESIHDVERMNDPEVKALRARISLRGDDSLTGPGGSRSVVEVKLRSGRTLSKEVQGFRGKSDNPLNLAEVEEKARALMKPMLGADQTEKLIVKLRNLETLKSVRELRPLLVAKARKKSAAKKKPAAKKTVAKKTGARKTKKKA